MKQRSLSAIIVILVMSLSVYFSAGAQGQSSGQGPLTIYHTGTDGKIVAAQTNVFTLGDPIWVGFPQGSSAPYLLSINDQNGSLVTSRRDGFLPADNLFPLSLDPSSFKPNHSYQVTLEVSQPTLPGMYAARLYGTTLLVLPARAYLSSENFSRNNGQTSISVRLSDAMDNPKTGVRLELSLTQGSMSLPITTEKTDAHGRVVYSFSEVLAAGQYQYEVNELDDGISVTPIQLPQFVVEPRTSALYTWLSNGVLQAALGEPTTGTPIGGRLLVLQHALNDGNWTIVSTTYTDDKGMASLPMPASPWRVSFNGDTFYSKSSSRIFTNPPPAQFPPNQAQPVLTTTTFVGTTFNNGHISIEISTRDIAVYNPSDLTLLGHIRWEVQVLQSNSWKSISWDAPMSMGISDLAGQHRITLQGTVGKGSLAVSMYLDAKSQDAPFTPLLMPVQLAALRGTGSYRLVWHLDTNTPTSFQFEQRTGDHRTLVAGPVTMGSSLNQSSSIENSLVAMAPDAKTVLIGINWDGAKSYYQGATATATPTGGSTAVTFGTFLLSSGESFVLPACPCPDGGGGGGGGGTVPTTTTTILPSSAYATVPAILSARVRDTNGNPIANGYVWWVDNSSKVLGNAITNSTGYAKMVWTAGATASQRINADYAGDSTYAPSYGSILTLNVGQTPTTIELLQPQQIAYSWDLYNYYSRAGRPIVVPVSILTLAASNNTSEKSVYTPMYSGPSTTPPHISGYGWAGLNQSSAVTITMNSTYSQTQNMNWTQNFYLPPCPNPPNCSTNPRTGHIYLTASVAPPSTLYSASSTSLNIPYQNVNSVPPTAPSIDGTAQSFCGHNTNSCSASLTTSQPNDVIIVYTLEALDLQTVCTFSVSDTAGLAWTLRASTSGRNDGATGSPRDQIAEFWAISSGTLSSDTITESILGCAGQYGGEYNGLISFGISGANTANPFDSTGAPESSNGYSNSPTVVVSTIRSNDMIIGGAQLTSLTPGTGFSMVASTNGGGGAAEYQVLGFPESYFPVTFSGGTGYWEEIADAVQPRSVSTYSLNQSSTPPPHVYVNVNATYPYINVQMQNVPVALEAYTSYLAYSLGGPTSSSVQCPSTGCYNYYSLPVLSSTSGSDFAFVCAFNGCNVPAANVRLNLYNSAGQLCITTFTDNRGIAHLNLLGPAGCSYPYYYLATSSQGIVLSELFGIEAISSPNPFYTNFQGTNYAIYAPQRTGRYLLHMHVWYQSSSFTVIYPSTSYPDVQQAFLSCCDAFLTVEKHPVGVNVGITPKMATVNDKVNATIVLTDHAEGRGMPSVSVVYTLRRNDPNPTTLMSGSLITDAKGNATLPLGNLSYGSYTLTASWAGNATSIGAAYQANFTIWKARTIIIISPGWIQATAGNTYLFTTMLIDNSTKTTIAVSGLHEQVYINGALYSSSQLCSTSGCSMVNYYLTNPGGNATFPWKPSSAGQFILNATFPSQSYYPSATFSIEASVTLRPVMLATSVSSTQPNTGDTVTWRIQAYDMLNNASLSGISITPYINGSSYPAVTTDSTGFASFSNVFTNKGFYNVTFQSAQTTVYNLATTHSSVFVFIQTTLSLTAGGTVYLGQQNTFSIGLKDANNNNLSGKLVKIAINGVSYANLTTDANGQASFNWRPSNIGNYTIGASYSATGPSDTGYRPSSANIMVNVKPQTIINTGTTGSGTQSVTLNAAQGSPAVNNGSLSFSIQYSLGSATITLNFNGKQSQATVNEWNEFGWICVARVFGTCVLSIPFLRIHTDTGVPNVFDLHAASFAPFGPASVSVDTGVTTGSDQLSEELGVVASNIIPVIGLLVIAAGGGPADLGADAVGGLLVAEGVGVAVIAAFLTMSRPSLKSFLGGLIVTALIGLGCAVFACPLDLLPILPPPIETAISAISFWTAYFVAGVIIPFALEGFIALAAICVMLLLAALIYSDL